jgi:hypothetical protein
MKLQVTGDYKVAISHQHSGFSPRNLNRKGREGRKGQEAGKKLKNVRIQWPALMHRSKRASIFFVPPLRPSRPLR